MTFDAETTMKTIVVLGGAYGGMAYTLSAVCGTLTCNNQVLGLSESYWKVFRKAGGLSLWIETRTLYS